MRIAFPSFDDYELEKVLSMAFKALDHSLNDVSWLRFLKWGTIKFRQALAQKRRSDVELSVNAMSQAITFIKNMVMEIFLGMENSHAMDKMGAMYGFEMDFDRLLSYVENALGVDTSSSLHVETRFGRPMSIRWRGSLSTGSLTALVLVNPMYASTLCSRCMRFDRISKVRKFGRRKVVCNECAVILDRDENAAITIAIITMMLASTAQRPGVAVGNIFNAALTILDTCTFLNGQT